MSQAISGIPPVSQSHPKADGDLQIVASMSDRNTDELVFGFVGAIGSGVTSTVRILADILEREFGYSINEIRISKLIEEAAPVVGRVTPDSSVPAHDRTISLQEIGNLLREKFSTSYLAEKAIAKIAVDRINPPSGIMEGYETQESGGNTVRLPVNRRRVHIIDSLKHPDEIKLLQKVYGDTFWVFGVFAPERIRETRLQKLGHPRNSLTTTFERDEEDGLAYGQKVRDTVHLADFFVRNDALTDVRLRSALRRYLDILFNCDVNTPTLEETAMYNAASQASSSACLSRQVGASIFSPTGELIGVGANDVPKGGGGLYCSTDGEKDHRCFKMAGGICHNDLHKEMLYAAIFSELKKDGLIDPKATQTNVRGAIRRTDVRNLIEYSRAVHAEMEAIMSVARGNKPGLVGATLFCTTFPCHSCARHIVASGIERVIYIEPYPKSLALELHDDLVATEENSGSGKVLFLQYEGIAPKNMLRLFGHGIPRKAGGRAVKVDARSARPVFPAPLDGFATREQMIVHALQSMEQASQDAPSRGSGG